MIQHWGDVHRGEKVRLNWKGEDSENGECCHRRWPKECSLTQQLKNSPAQPTEGLFSSSMSYNDDYESLYRLRAC
jgi:hypothetical protein